MLSGGCVFRSQRTKRWPISKFRFASPLGPPFSPLRPVCRPEFRGGGKTKNHDLDPNVGVRFCPSRAWPRLGRWVSRLRLGARLATSRLSAARPGWTQLSSTLLVSVRLSSTRLNSTQLDSARPDSTRLDSARLYPTRFRSLGAKAVSGNRAQFLPPVIAYLPLAAAMRLR